MDNFEEYLRQGEPNKAEKAKVWRTAIGLQNHSLKNREVNIHYIDTVKTQNDTVNDNVFYLIKQK